MTLIVGIKCSDGIVLGADGAATYGVMGQQTIRQPVRKKLKKVGPGIIIGTSGPVGLGQRFAGSVERLREIGNLYKDPKNDKHRYRSFEVMRVLRQVFWQDIEMEGGIAKASVQLFGPMAMQNANSYTAVAMAVDGGPTLMHFDPSASPEEATNDLPFVSFGSGQMIADPFLALIRRLYWPERLPTLQEGLFAVYWTLHHAILTHPGGVADPKQIMVLHKPQAEWVAKEFDESELKEYREHVSRVEACMQSFDKSPASSEPPEFKPS